MKETEKAALEAANVLKKFRSVRSLIITNDDSTAIVDCNPPSIPSALISLANAVSLIAERTGTTPTKIMHALTLQLADLGTSVTENDSELQEKAAWLISELGSKPLIH